MRDHTLPRGSQTAHFDALELNSGRLAPIDIAYETYGRLSEDGGNAILVCHALTGSAHAGSFYAADGSLDGAEGWWDPLIGPGRPLDTDQHFVICSNFLGSCYGTTGPASVDPASGRQYGRRFPAITVRDMVRAQRLLIDRLGVRRLRTVAGGSLGGFQVLEWAAMYPELVQSIVPIATSLAHSAWCIALNQAAREAIRLDPAFFGGDYATDSQPVNGLGLARQIAMISYRSAPSFESRFGRRLSPGAARPDPFEWRTEGNAGVPSGDDFEVSHYLRYQGHKLVERFDANTYIAITEAMDRYDVGAGRGSAAQALSAFSGPVLCLGIDSDVLYPTYEQRALVEVFRGNGNAARYVEVASPHGHDAFLMEWDAMAAAIGPFVAALPR
ncbi:MAG: homoserine O-acetyltransferase MetX [Dehalococcoidia bacterium]